MAFLPYDPNRKPSIKGPVDDWHQQWGGGGGIQATSPYFDPGSPLYGQTPPPLTGTVGASGPGGGDVPFQAGAQPPPMPDWSMGGRTQWDQAMPSQGADIPSYGMGGRYGPPSQQGTAPSYVGPGTGESRGMGGPGGFTPLSQLGRGGAGYGATPPSYVGTGAGESRGMGGPPPAPGAGAGWSLPSYVGPGTGESRGMGGPGGGGMVLLRAPNGQTRQVPADQVAHYLARGATRG